MASGCAGRSSGLVRLESPSTDKAAVDRCGAAVEELLVSMGGDVRRLRQDARGDHVRAEWGGGDPQLLLLGHFDTVWPVGQLERMPLRSADGRLHGPGVFDMKAGIGVAMLAVRALQALAGRPAAAHRHVVDGRRRDREPHVEGRRSRKKRGAAPPCWCSSRRCQEAVRRRAGRGSGSSSWPFTACRRTPASIPARARARSARWPARSSRSKRCRTCRAASASTSVASRGARARTSCRTTRRRRSTSGCRRWRTPRDSRRRCAVCARRSPARALK